MNIATLQKLLAELQTKGPEFLKALSDALAKAEASGISTTFPGLAGIEKEAAAFVNFLSSLEATTLPYIVEIVNLLATVFPPKAAA